MSKINYDQEAKIMTIQVSGKKSVDSDVQDNIVVDYDRKGEITKIEIMNVGLNEFRKNKKKLESFLILGGHRSGAGGFTAPRSAGRNK